jgi:hypothetical protein
MNVAQLSLAQFLGNVIDSGETTNTADMLIEAYGLRSTNFPALCDYGDWKVLALNANHTATGLSYKGELVGLYVGEIIAIDYPSTYDGPRGLSVPMILLAAEHRPIPTERKLTVAGKIALTRAWEVAKGLRASPWWPCP